MAHALQQCTSTGSGTNNGMSSMSSAGAQSLDLSFLAGLNPELYQTLTQSLGLISSAPSATSQGKYCNSSSAFADSFVPGAISNRTLEHLTESTMRPYRAIRGEQSSRPGPLYNVCHNDQGTDRSLMSLGASNDCFSGSFMSDPDSSGISNGAGSELSDLAIAEIMNSLHLGPQTPYPPYPGLTTSPQPTTPSASQLQGQGSPTPFDLLRALSLQADIPLQRAAVPMCPGGAEGTAGSPLYNDFSLSADLFASRPWTALNTLCATSANDPYSIERAAKLYRNAATISEPTCTWSGQLPVKMHRNPAYSCKVFLGGVPWDITEAGLQSSFRQFGPLRIEWPGKDGKHPRYPSRGKELPVGYVYIHFESERSVKSLLLACTHDFSNGGEYYYKISSRRMRSKEVQVIPWVLSDSNFVRQPSQRLDPQKTVFVGALHGMLNAEGLAHIMNDLFDNVVYAGIDTDKHKYPIGSGRVTFSSYKSYVKAVSAAFVEIKTSKFTKKIQIDPYLEESPCGVCGKDNGSYFCRNFTCFRYYCRACWQLNHRSDTSACYHKPLMRNNKNSTATSTVAAFAAGYGSSSVAGSP